MTNPKYFVLVDIETCDWEMWNTIKNLSEIDFNKTYVDDLYNQPSTSSTDRRQPTNQPTNVAVNGEAKSNHLNKIDTKTISDLYNSAENQFRDGFRKRKRQQNDTESENSSKKKKYQKE